MDRRGLSDLSRRQALAGAGGAPRGRGTDGDHGGGGHWDNDEGDKPVSCGGTKGEGWELKTGTNHNQHLVAINPDGSGTRFGTVLVQIHGKKGTL